MQEGIGQLPMRMRRNRGKGEVVEVEGGGRILRSLGRKDRHSKVCTSKGPRDRRVRLSADTAIQFYDVQDRLGYDRPSKAIDWLMKEAKAAIDALNADDHHHDEDLQLSVPSATTIFNPSHASCQISGDQDQQNSFHSQTSSYDNYPFGLISSRNRCQGQENPILVPQEISLFSPATNPLDFTWNLSHDSGESFAFFDREPLQSICPPTIIHTPNNGFAAAATDDDDGFLGFCFQQGLQVQEGENDNLASKHYLSSGTSLLHYQD